MSWRHLGAPPARRVDGLTIVAIVGAILIAGLALIRTQVIAIPGDAYDIASFLLSVAGGGLLLGGLFGLFRRWATKRAGIRAPGAPSPHLSGQQIAALVLLPIWSLVWSVGGAFSAAAALPGLDWGVFAGLQIVLLLIGIGGVVSARNWQWIAGSALLGIALVAMMM